MCVHVRTCVRMYIHIQLMSLHRIRTYAYLGSCLLSNLPTYSCLLSTVCRYMLHSVDCEGKTILVSWTE